MLLLGTVVSVSINHSQYFQLFEHCLAPDTLGDGTGCDNMTAVIVKFKQDFKQVTDCVAEAGVAKVNGHDSEPEQPAAKKLKLDTGSGVPC